MGSIARFRSWATLPCLTARILSIRWPAVAASFREESTGGVYTVVVNHLKSKGSTCPEEVGVDPDPNPVDQVGSCNTVRTLAAGM